ncbi:MAG: DMT family transporter [Clostridiales bacterium]|nr:DMT family transporter [Clostridiales bacterium]MDD6390623.1 DMT family transporter [Bacillota bacterium]MDY5975182.1 DMT family transporter [Anaerovoracaceae bacterium]
MRKETFSRTWFVILACFAACTLWGSAFPCIKTGYRMFDIGPDDFASQILFAGIRFFAAGLMVIAYASAFERKIIFPSGPAWKKVIVLSFLQTSLQYALFYTGLANTGAVNGSIISGSGGFFTMIVGALFMSSDRMTLRKTLGCILGFGGILIMNITPDFTLEVNPAGDGLLILSSVSSAFSSLMMKIYAKGENPVMLSGYQFAAGGLVLVLTGVCLGGRLDSAGPKGIILLLYMAFISSAAYTIWSVLLKYNDISKIAVFKFIIPVMGVILSAVFLPDADIDASCMAALALVVAGIFTVNGKRQLST